MLAFIMNFLPWSCFALMVKASSLRNWSTDYPKCHFSNWYCLYSGVNSWVTNVWHVVKNVNKCPFTSNKQNYSSTFKVVSFKMSSAVSVPENEIFQEQVTRGAGGFLMEKKLAECLPGWNRGWAVLGKLHLWSANHFWIRDKMPFLVR